MDSRGAAQYQLEEQQRLRGVVGARLRSPWWVHVAGGLVAGATVVVFLEAPPFWDSALGFVLGVVGAQLPSLVARRRGIRPGRSFGRQRPRTVRSVTLTALAIALGVGFAAVGIFVVDPDDPRQVAAMAMAAACIVGGGLVFEGRSDAPPVSTRKATPAPDELLDDRERFRICGVLAALDGAEVGALADVLDLSESMLRHHVEVLEKVRYVTTEQRRGPGGSDQTWVSLYHVGRKALTQHLAEQQRLAEPDPPAD